MRKGSDLTGLYEFTTMELASHLSTSVVSSVFSHACMVRRCLGPASAWLSARRSLKGLEARSGQSLCPHPDQHSALQLLLNPRRPPSRPIDHSTSCRGVTSVRRFLPRCNAAGNSPFGDPSHCSE